MDIPAPWLATSQQFWETQLYIGNDSATRDWFHVYAAAMARCKANLHAEFKQGELAYLLGRDREGQYVPMASNRLTNLIRECVQRGLLAKGSGQLCLNLPANAFGCTLPGSNTPCQTCATAISRPRRVPSVVRRITPNRVTSEEHKRATTYAQVTAPPVHSPDVPHTSPECKSETYEEVPA